MLSGAVRSIDELAETDLRRMFPRFQEGHLDHNLRLLQRVEALAATLGITSGQLSLAWVLAQGGDIAAIPGTRRQAHLEQNVASAALRLDPATLATLDQAIPVGAVAGDRRAALDAGIKE
ncbi:aldo/keto reductase [Micromonospora pisi]|uniref:aldo/keto reductase n=1 Tax=Micromonospora pisi TaxID=589240 RepID=UPI000EB307ED|nr:aldo/keto reductase [Micromonospora pisi]